MNIRVGILPYDDDVQIKRTGALVPEVARAGERLLPPQPIDRGQIDVTIQNAAEGHRSPPCQTTVLTSVLVTRVGNTQSHSLTYSQIKAADIVLQQSLQYYMYNTRVIGCWMPGLQNQEW